MFQLSLVLIILSCKICGLVAILNDPCLKVYKNSMRFHGAAQSSNTDEKRCWLDCQQTLGCKAFEWVPSNPTEKCFFFTTSDPPTNTNNPGITHYVLECQCYWKEYRNYQSYFGVEQAHTTEAGCKKECLWDATCKAVEWKTIPVSPRCYFFDNANIPAYAQASNINHYIWQCSKNIVQSRTTSFLLNIQSTAVPGCFWSFTRNQNTANGMKKTYARTLQQCKKACMDYDSCKQGLDWSPNELNPSDRCWVSSSQYMYSTYGVNHYTYNCSSGSLSVWKFQMDLSTHYGQLQPTVYTLGECKEFCISLTPCRYGFDWVYGAPLGQGCWISTNDKLHPAQKPGEICHYSLSQKKSGIPDNHLKCTWTKMENSNSPRGRPQPLYETLEECKAYCIQTKRSQCMGIDWNPNSQSRCWFSVSGDITPYPGVDHYYLSCPRESTPAPTNQAGATTNDPSNEGRCGYIRFERSSSINGIATTYQNDVICRDQCTVQFYCKAYEWRMDDPINKCWFYNNNAEPKFNNMYPRRTYYLYKQC